jgi:hypothetical protein
MEKKKSCRCKLLLDKDLAQRGRRERPKSSNDKDLRSRIKKENKKPRNPLQRVPRRVSSPSPET